MISELHVAEAGKQERHPMASTRAPKPGLEVGAPEALNGLCPYFTMFPLEFPLRILSREKRPDAVVLDPFCGRGTTLYAARLRDFVAFGMDSNPTAVAISEAKLANASPGAILRAYDELVTENPRSRSPQGDFWNLAFHPETLCLLSKLRTGLDVDCGSAARRALRGILLGALHGPLRKGQPSYFSNQMPRTFAPKPAYAVEFWTRKNYVAPKVDVRAIVERRAYRFYGPRVHIARGRAVLGDSRQGRAAREVLKEAKVDWVITSPPYYGLRTYLPDQWLRLWFVGGPSRPQYSAVGQVSHLSPYDFASDLARVWKNLQPLCRRGATMVIRFGSIRDRDVDPVEIVKASLKDTCWRIDTIRAAGSADDGRRQSDHFSTAPMTAAPEYDVWTRLD